jgi:hypothetical protein
MMTGKLFMCEVWGASLEVVCTPVQRTYVGAAPHWPPIGYGGGYAPIDGIMGNDGLMGNVAPMLSTLMSMSPFCPF